MMKIEFIYDNDCPNVESARSALCAAIQEAGLNVDWKEWDRNDSSSPEYVRDYGSPTILINGQDIAGANAASDENCCRVYQNEDLSFAGVPSRKLITQRLIEAKQSVSDTDSSLLTRLKAILPTFPAIGAVLIPGLTCPACWPAYAGLLGSLGLGFVNYTPYLMPLTVVFLIVALLPFIQRARRTGKYGLLFAGGFGALLIVTGRFLLQNDLVTYAGVLFLIVGSILNAIPKKKTIGTSCCVDEGK